MTSWGVHLRGASNNSWWGDGVSSHLAPDNEGTTSLSHAPACSNLLLNLWSGGSCYKQQEAANLVPALPWTKRDLFSHDVVDQPKECTVMG